MLSRRVFLRENKVPIDQDRAACIWAVLVANAEDLMYTPTVTHIPYDLLAQCCNKDFKWVTRGIDDLVTLGFVQKVRRFNNSNKTLLFLRPWPEWVQGDPHEVISVEDVPGFKQERKPRASSRVVKEPRHIKVSEEELDFLNDFFYRTFDYHVEFANEETPKRFRNYLKRCINIAGTYELARDVVVYVLLGDYELGSRRLEYIRDAENLGAYVHKCFAGWVAEYQALKSETAADEPESSEENPHG